MFKTLHDVESAPRRPRAVSKALRVNRRHRKEITREVENAFRVEIRAWGGEHAWGRARDELRAPAAVPKRCVDSESSSERSETSETSEASERNNLRDGKRVSCGDCVAGARFTKRGRGTPRAASPSRFGDSETLRRASERSRLGIAPRAKFRDDGVDDGPLGAPGAPRARPEVKTRRFGAKTARFVLTYD